jgi:hypothetical protein
MHPDSLPSSCASKSPFSAKLGAYGSDSAASKQDAPYQARAMEASIAAMACGI